MKIGILGFAHRHARFYAAAVQASAQASLSGIADTDASRGRRVAEELSIPHFESVDDLLCSEAEAVIVCGENSDRERLCLDAVEAGKHALCVMPMASSPEKAEDTIKAFREKKLVLAAALPFRCSSPIARAREILNSGKIGDIVAFKLVHRAVRPLEGTEESHVQLAEHIVHGADLVRWFGGSAVKEVFAEVGKGHGCAIVTLTLEDGAFGTVDASWVDPPRSYPASSELTFEITGTEGFLSVDAFGQKVVSYSERVGRGQDVCWGDDMYLALVSDFADAISGDRPPAATGEDGLEALRIAFAAYRSAENNQPVGL